MSDTPELGQLAFGNPTGDYSCPHWVDALVEEILTQIGRVYWNRHQTQWERFEAPEIPGIEFRSYYWGDDEEEAAKPNLKHGDIEVRWYKHPGRGTSLNVEPEPARIIAWFDSAIGAIYTYDEETDRRDR